MTRWLNHCCNGKATMRFSVHYKLQVTVNNIKMIGVAQKCVRGEFVSPGTTKPT